jgi:flagellar motor switch protein FliN/FliY
MPVTEPNSKTSPAAAPAKGDSPLAGINPRLIEAVSVTLEAYLGEARMTVADLTQLSDQSVVPLDAALNQAVELRLNGVAVARGELVAVGDSFAVRLTEVSK